MQQMLVGELRGTVVDDAGGSPISTATVAVWQGSDSTLVTGAVTDADGSFVIDRLRPGRYYVRVSFIGYATYATDMLNLTREAPKADLGTIRLLPDTQQLDEVEVTGERETVEFAIDRTVYNVKDQPISTGGTATDVLQNVPSVEVDIDGNVSLRGNQNVAILINGKPSPMRGEFLASFLQQLPASMIEKVEVIPNPSAKYDPEGMAGILNIVMKQDADLGLGGGLSLGAGTGDKYNASGNVNYQQGKVSLFANYGFRYEDRNDEGFNFRENRYLDPLTYLDQDNFGLRNRTSHVLNTTLDYSLSDKNVLSASALLSQRGGDRSSTYANFLLDADRDAMGRYDRTTSSVSDGFNMDYKLGFKRTIEASQHELSAELRFNRSNEDSFDEFRQQNLTLDGEAADATPDLQANDLDSHENEWTAQVDYTRPLGGTRLETGYKGTLRQLDNTFYSETFDYAAQAFMPDASLNNEFVYDEQVHAVYGIASRGFGKFDAQVGVRLEQALTNFDLTTTDEAFENNYFSIFPSAFLSYKLTDARQVKLSYSKRVQRPRTRMLNPFTSFDDPLNLFVGNPYLQPEYTHAVEMAYQQFSQRGTISVTPFYRHSVDVMRRLKTVDDDGISRTTFENFDTSDSYGAEVVGSLKLGNSLSGFASFNGYKLVTDGSNVDGDLGNSAFGWSVRFNASWQVRPGLSMQAFYFYRAPIDIEQGRISSFSMANIALSQKLLNDKASLSLRLSDPFDTMGFDFVTSDANFYQESSRKWESRIAYLTFTYNFGQQSRRRNRGDREMDGGEMEDVGIN
jgi:outer membrane cobalamin receptor